MSNIIVNNFSIEKIKASENHIDLLLKDNAANKFDAIVKDNVDLFIGTYKEGDYVLCKARVKKRKNKEVLEIIQIKIIVNSSDVDLEFYIKKFEKLLSRVKDKDYKIILEQIFEDENILDLFHNYPATIDSNHNYKHGLIQHTIEVAETALLLGEYYRDIDLDLLITGCLSHDLGKLQSFDFEENNDRIIETDWERLLGHSSISSLYISKAIPTNVESHKAMLLYHLILSYKGKEGPVDYKMKESFILNQANNISKELNFKEWYIER